ncbi:hypothetical protein [Planomicrobium sp. CPCC 101079]|uniref:hypothetical protein n=1 Tax=Planomicrobium sp. CPCC 101079 TaxID=2599618 RepID=UPI0011B46E7B|nr:hypothetical protein [Planomicrobium sp. CPCC 101079]TWT01881.1 hypothetical protein FQV28_14715 [Planomicrobium sp. CPCC 101079]
MSISVIERGTQRRGVMKAASVYLAVSLFVFAAAKVYGLFGHGVASPAMTWAFLYPLIGGGFFCLLKWRAVQIPVHSLEFRLFSNLYNSGIATLAAGRLLQGIVEIAGASSGYIVYFYTAGIVLIVGGLTFYLRGSGRYEIH